MHNKRETEEVNDVLVSGKWNRWQGTKVAEFEKKFAKYQEAEYCLAVCNGTVALEIALKALELPPGSEVIVPAYTFISTATAVLQNGCVPVFADIDPQNYCISPDDILSKITERTKCIIPVHLYGYPANMDAILDIASRHKLFVLEDACQAHGAKWKGRKVGALGDLGCFSFQASKNIACGEGGAIVTNNKELYNRCFVLHHIGRRPEAAFYEHGQLGTNARLSEFLGGILLAQFERLEEQFLIREKNAAYLTRRLKKINGITPPAEAGEGSRSAHHVYVFRYNKDKFNGLSRDDFIKALSEKGIPAGGAYPIPLYRNPLFQSKKFGIMITYLLEKSYDKNIDYSNVICAETEKICGEAAVVLSQNLLLGDRQACDTIINAIKEIAVSQKK